MLFYFSNNYYTIITANKGEKSMPKIRPVSDLRNYPEVLNEIKRNDPVFLTKNGRGTYVIMDIEDYEELKGTVHKNKRHVKDNIDDDVDLKDIEELKKLISVMSKLDKMFPDDDDEDE